MSPLRRPEVFLISALRFMLCAITLSMSLGLQAQTATEHDHRGTPHDEVQKKMLQRDWAGAMQEIDDYLVERPRDPQMRFWRARLLETLQRTSEAMEAYQQLAQEFPELAEVQNNLGVMLAADGQIDEARRAFDMALRNNPTLAIAHENLGDVLMHLARRSYAYAEKHGGTSTQLSGKIRALESVLQLTLPKP
jgi:Tfp pilus assembly protein PilF